MTESVSCGDEKSNQADEENKLDLKSFTLHAKSLSSKINQYKNEIQSLKNLKTKNSINFEINYAKLTDILFKKYYWIVHNEKLIKIDLEIRCLEKKKLFYQMNLLGHFKTHTYSNLELFDVLPDLPSIYSDLNCEDNNFLDSDELFNKSDSIVDLNTNNNNNNNNDHESILLDESIPVSERYQFHLANLNESFNTFKMQINSYCLRAFEMFICFILFVYNESKHLDKKNRINLVKIVVGSILFLTFLYLCFCSRTTVIPNKTKLNWLQTNLDQVCMSLSNLIQEL